MLILEELQGCSLPGCRCQMPMNFDGDLPRVRVPIEIREAVEAERQSINTEDPELQRVLQLLPADPKKGSVFKFADMQRVLVIEALEARGWEF